jgi:hypothetical protein
MGVLIIRLLAVVRQADAPWIEEERIPYTTDLLQMRVSTCQEMRSSLPEEANGLVIGSRRKNHIVERGGRTVEA